MEPHALPPVLLPRHFRLPLLLLLLLLLPTLITVAASTFPPRCLDSNRRALLQLKAGLRDPDCRLSSWTGRDCCQWSGVTCDNGTGAVVRLDVSSSQCPPPQHVDDAATLRWLSGLSSLWFLSMSGVDLSPVDSTELLRLLNSGLPSLAELHLAYCRLSGIPHSLPTPAVNFTSLAVVDLSGNTFVSGTIPTWLLDVSTLVSLTMSECGLYGAVPPGLSKLPNMETLILESNSLTGSFPSSIGKLCNLRMLYLDHNKLVGELPETLDACTSAGTPLPGLVELQLRYNRISGKLPGWLWELKNIKYLALDSNMFSGPLPLNLGNLSQLVTFSASDNQLSGSVSEAHLTPLKNLDSFYISRNPALTLDMRSDWKPPFQLQNLWMDSCKVGPEFPTWIKNQRGLKSLNLSDAGISDTIPTWFWCAFSQLQELNLSSNRITGIVPESIVAVNGLTSLDLSNNRFSGNIPFSLVFMAACRGLSFLDLSDNNFSVAIPDGGGMQPFNMSAFHGNPHLCGPPTDTRCGGDSSQISGKTGGGTVIVHYLRLGIRCLGIAVLLIYVCVSRRENGAGDTAAVPTGSTEQPKEVREQRS